MHHYYTRKSANPPSVQSRRRSRFSPARPVIYLPQVRNTRRSTTPLFLFSEISQHAEFAKRRPSVITAPLSSGRRAMPGTDPLLPSISPTRNPTSQTLEPITEKDTHPTSRIRRRVLEEETSLRYQFSRIVRGMWQLLKDVPPGQLFILAFLFLNVMFALLWIVNVLGHIDDRFVNLLYLYSGMTASVIIIYEFIIKKVRK